MNWIQRLTMVVCGVLLIPALPGLPALGQRWSPDYTRDKAKLVRALDAIEPWGKTMNYSEESWKNLSAAAEAFLALPPPVAADVLREYQKSWMPLLHWEQMLAPFRRGDFSNSAGGVFSLAEVQNAHREFLRLRMPGTDSPDLKMDLKDPLPLGVQRASKVYLLLRVVFELPETSDEKDDVSGGDRQFMTAPRFFGRNGNKAWPIIWTGQHPRLTAPLFLYHGTPYNAVSDFYQLAQKYKVRSWHAGGWSTTYSFEWPTPGVTELMTACGFGGHANTVSGVPRPNLNFSGDIAPSTALAYLGSVPERANSRDTFDWTPLMFAVSSGRLQIARALIEQRARVNDENYNGTTPVMMAAVLNQSEMLSLLLEHGARLDATDDRGLTPLMYAVSAGSVENARLLLEKGADANAQDELGRSALMVAIEHADSNRESAVPMIQLLLPKSDLRLKTIWGVSVMELSRKVRDKNVQRILRTAGAAN
jgi:hypothetical protein